MAFFACRGLVLVAGLSTVLALSASAQDIRRFSRPKSAAEWTWEDRSGRIQTRMQLHEILKNHRLWQESSLQPVPRGLKADLSGATLEGIELKKVDLSQAELAGTKLLGADLSGADLSAANLKGAYLTSSNLAGADLSSSELSDAVLNLANLRGAYMQGASLARARLYGTDLTETDLTDVDLARASLENSILSRTVFNGANLDGTIFEPQVLPDIRSILLGVNLARMCYVKNPAPLVELREKFRQSGYREEERKIIYSVRKTEAKLKMEKATQSWIDCVPEWLLTAKQEARRSRLPPDEWGFWYEHCPYASILAGWTEYWFSTVFFDWTCQFGMSPGRALQLGLGLWILCSLLYAVAIHSSGESGLYRIYPADLTDGPGTMPIKERVRPIELGEAAGRWSSRRILWREARVFGTAMFFSAMSAFNIGFRDINFGRWLRLLTRREYDISARGWARVIAGWQSLISVYLIALWILTYFGRPFE